jgi:hypothetical protein
MGWFANATRWLERAGLSFLLVACAHGAVAGAGAMTLTLPRTPAPDEAVHLNVKVGRLPSGARVIVRTSKGEIVGAISPFGAVAREHGGTYVIPVPRDAVQDGKVSLQLEVQEKGTSARVPTGDEVQSVTLALAPITPLK